MHLCSILSKSTKLWPSWINGTVLKRSKFWLMSIPTDYSWIWRKVLGFRPLALRFLRFHIRNDLGTSVWFDPWFNGRCLATSTADPISHLTTLTSTVNVNSLLSSAGWRLPLISRRRHHVSSNFVHWLNTFDYPTFDLSKTDYISWDSVIISKLKTHDIWSSVIETAPAVAWEPTVWHRVQVQRFSHLSWLLCLGRISTKARMASFGLQVDTACMLCVGGRENVDHLFVNCSYSRFILLKLMDNLHISIVSWAAVDCWADLLAKVGAVHGAGHRHLGFLALNVFGYHLWRERNFREHNKGCFHPMKLLEGILLDIRFRLGTSKWFIKLCTNDVFLSSWLML